MFNLTNHQNPRDVYPVAGAARGTFASSVGPICAVHDHQVVNNPG